ncbi:unnamed protein product [Ilex paraguariensis]|uniref:Shikimate dehydrogenase substrate binding N-terminal domain-containing protein n=1 Tax=Ilex paraguariensis TaxID=185542 RepID=A0ABC8S5P6_9AQUA
MLHGMYQAKAQGADLVEVRLDCIRNFRPRGDLQILLKNKPLPVIIVYRPKWEGGQYDGDEQMRLEALLLAQDLGADYIEFELKVGGYTFFRPKWEGGQYDGDEQMRLEALLLAQDLGADYIEFELKVGGYTFFRPKWEGGQYDGDEQMRLEALLLAQDLGADYIEFELKVGGYTFFRPKWEGGQYDGDEQMRLEALLLAQDLGADYIEFELKVASDLTKEHKLKRRSRSKIIVSCYVDSVSSPKVDLSHLVAHMQSTGADMIKLVANATNITEITRIFHLLSHCQVPLIAYSNGERGLISQLLGPKFGGFLVYGSIEDNLVPGLPILDSLRKAYNVECIDADTKVFGLISKPVSHSKGPILHNPTFKHVGYNGIYVPMLVDDLKEFFCVYSSPDFAGFSVGIPYKEAAIEFCDEVHPLAQSIGAVNTIIRRPSDGKLVGYNTDCEASITAIEDALKGGCNNGDAFLPSPLTGILFVLVGAGGAGRALAFGAKSRGARVVIFDIDFGMDTRSSIENEIGILSYILTFKSYYDIRLKLLHDRAKSLADAVSGQARPYEDLVNFRPEKGTILANATPLGMHPNMDRIPVAEATLCDCKLVFDAVYTPRKTTLLKAAEAAGAIIVSGVEMFLRQAIDQFNLFTGNKGTFIILTSISEYISGMVERLGL